MPASRTLIPAALGALALIPATAAARSPAPVAHAARLGSKVVLYKSIGGVPIGITPAALRHKLGRPSHTIRVSGKISEVEYRAKDGTDIINVTFDTLHKGDPAEGIFGFARDLHTSKGIHSGSTVRQLKRAYGHSLHSFPGGFALYKGKPGAIGSTTTQFGTAGGKVSLIDIQTTFNDLG